MKATFKEYHPAEDGVAPDDWDRDASTVLYRFRGKFVPAVDPAWYVSDVYRYVPRKPSALASSLPEDDAARNELPMFDGLLAYFPNALAAVAQVSKIGNDQHNPGKPLGWARGKSTDHLNKIVRHTVDAGRKDVRGVRHSARLAWRALAMLQEELEREEGAPMSRGSYL